MTDPKTIDNLGIGPSIRWAQDQKFIDQSIIKDSPLVSIQTTIDVAAPCFISEFDLLFQTMQRFVPWALFSPPDGFDSQRMRIFTYQTIPSLGTEERRMVQKEKIKKCIASIKKKKKKRVKKRGGKDLDENKEKDRSFDTVMSFLEAIDDLDELMARISAFRNQYSKG